MEFTFLKPFLLYGLAKELYIFAPAGCFIAPIAIGEESPGNAGRRAS